jgi:cytochrome c-type biogenesis protein CcmH
MPVFTRWPAFDPYNTEDLMIGRWPRWADRLGWVLALAALAVAVFGVVGAPQPAEDRVETIASSIRCPVCQSVSVAESPAQQARDMRVIIEQQVDEGRSDDEIIAFFVARYGDWILLEPPARGDTLPLWVLPPLLLVFGIVVALRRRRRIKPWMTGRPQAKEQTVGGSHGH